MTVDQRLPYQQNLPKFAIGVVILVARSNRFADLEPLLPATLSALTTIGPGETVRVSS